MESTFLVTGFRSGMSTSDLLALRIRQLQKKPEDMKQASLLLKKMRFKSKEQFEKRFKHKLFKSEHSPKDLVLVRNSAVEQELDRKSKPRYMGPYEVVRRCKGGSYLLQELNGATSRFAIAAFRLLPYVSRDDPRLLQLSPSPEEDSDSSSSEEAEGESDSD